jgi:RES domain
MWTAIALAPEFRRYARTVWRVVEAQHRISTNRLTDNLEVQARLEQLAEAAKPDLPEAAQHIHYLLASPFRYGHGVASRFRRAKERPGIFYASEREATAIAETAYWRLRFFARSPGFVPPKATTEHLSFSVPLKVTRALDLTKPPFDAEVASWQDPLDYSHCQDFAVIARQASAQLLRTGSARDAAGGINIALLDPSGFASIAPDYRQTWHFRFEQNRLTAMAAFPGGARHVFTPEQFGMTL